MPKIVYNLLRGKERAQTRASGTESVLFLHLGAVYMGVCPLGNLTSSFHKVSNLHFINTSIIKRRKRKIFQISFSLECIARRKPRVQTMNSLETRAADPVFLVPGILPVSW